MPIQSSTLPSAPRVIDTSAQTVLRLRETDVAAAQRPRRAGSSSSFLSASGAADDMIRVIREMNFSTRPQLTSSHSSAHFAKTPHQRSRTASKGPNSINATASSGRNAYVDSFALGLAHEANVTSPRMSSKLPPESTITPAAIAACGGGGARAVYWTSALCLPNNTSAYSALNLRAGDEKEANRVFVRFLGDDLITSDRQLRCIKRLWLSLTIAEPQLRSLPFVPYLCVAVARSLPSSPMASFEVAMHVLGNVLSQWQRIEYRPCGLHYHHHNNNEAISPTLTSSSSPPVQILVLLDDLLRTIEEGQRGLLRNEGQDLFEGRTNNNTGNNHPGTAYRSVWEHMNYSCGANANDYFWGPLQTFFLYNFLGGHDEDEGVGASHLTKGGTSSSVRARRACGVPMPKMSGGAVESELLKAWQSFFDDIMIPKRKLSLYRDNGMRETGGAYTDKLNSELGGVGGLAPASLYDPLVPPPSHPLFSPRGDAFNARNSRLVSEANGAEESTVPSAAGLPSPLALHDVALISTSSQRILYMAAVAMVLIKRKALLRCTTREEVQKEIARSIFCESATSLSDPTACPSVALFSRKTIIDGEKSLRFANSTRIKEESGGATDQQQQQHEHSSPLGLAPPTRHFSRRSVRPVDLIGFQMNRLRRLVYFVSECAFGGCGGPMRSSAYQAVSVTETKRPLPDAFYLRSDREHFLRQLTSVVHLPQRTATTATARSDIITVAFGSSLLPFSSSPRKTQSQEQEEAYLESLIEAGVTTRLHVSHPHSHHYAFLRAAGGPSSSCIATKESTMSPEELAARIGGTFGGPSLHGLLHSQADQEINLAKLRAGRVTGDYFPFTTTVIDVPSSSTMSKYSTLEAIEESEARIYRSVKNELETLELLRGVRGYGDTTGLHHQNDDNHYNNENVNDPHHHNARITAPPAPLQSPNAVLYAQYEALKSKVTHTGHVPPVKADGFGVTGGNALKEADEGRKSEDTTALTMAQLSSIVGGAEGEEEGYAFGHGGDAHSGYLHYRGADGRAVAHRDVHVAPEGRVVPDSIIEAVSLLLKAQQKGREGSAERAGTKIANEMGKQQQQQQESHQQQRQISGRALQAYSHANVPTKHTDEYNYPSRFDNQQLPATTRAYGGAKFHATDIPRSDLRQGHLHVRGTARDPRDSLPLPPSTETASNRNEHVYPLQDMGLSSSANVGQGAAPYHNTGLPPMPPPPPLSASVEAPIHHTQVEASAALPTSMPLLIDKETERGSSSADLSTREQPANIIVTTTTAMYNSNITGIRSSSAARSSSLGYHSTNKATSGAGTESRGEQHQAPKSILKKA